MLPKGLKAESPLSRGVQAFLGFCRMEKGLSPNSLDAYSRDLAGFRGVRRRPYQAGVTLMQRF